MKKIIALLIAVFMLSTVAFAAVGVTADDITYDGVSDTIVYTISIANDGTASEISAQAYFDTEVFAFVSASDAAGMKWSKNKKRVNIVTAVADELTITLKVLDKDAAKAGSEISLKSVKVVDSDALAVFTADEIVTTVKGAAAPAVPEAPAYAVESENYDDIVVGDVTYTNVYVGEYSATPVAGVGISKIGVKNATEEVASKTVAIEGGAKVTFKIALLGVEDGEDVGLTAFAEYDFAE